MQVDRRYRHRGLSKSSKRRLLWRSSNEDNTEKQKSSQTSDGQIPDGQISAGQTSAGQTLDAKSAGSAGNLLPRRDDRFVRLLGHSHSGKESEEDKKKLDALRGVNRNIEEIQSSVLSQFNRSIGRSSRMGLGRR